MIRNTKCSYQIYQGHVVLGGNHRIAYIVKFHNALVYMMLKRNKQGRDRRRVAGGRGVAAPFGVTWWATFRRRTDLERRSPRARVRGECTLSHPAPAARCPPAVALGPQHRTPLLHLHSPLVHHPPPPPDSLTTDRHHLPLPTRLPHTSTDDDAAHLSHKIPPTSLLTSSLTNDCANLVFIKKRHIRSPYYNTEHFLCKTERLFTQKILIHKQNIEHNLWSWA